MKKLLTVLFAISIPIALSAQEVKNLKVLSFETKKATMDFMKKNIAPALGVKCAHCHNVRDFPSDENPHKEIARQMMILTRNINKNSLAPLKYEPITCWTCHRGDNYPPRSKDDKKKGHKH